MSDFFEIFTYEFNSEFAVTIEDDSRVAYAYLLNGDKIIGDVWLYNQSATPEKTQWNEDEMPFLNPLEFVDPNQAIHPIQNATEVRVAWRTFGEDKSIEADVFIREKLIAILRPEALSGWSSVVRKDGPLAHKWVFV